MVKAENEWRVDGPTKVMGRARYVDDLRRADLGFDMLHAVIVTSTVPKGRITKIETAQAEALPGVRAVMTHQNAPRLRKVFSLSMSEIGDIRPLQDDRIHYHGEAVAVVIADDQPKAQTAAGLLEIDYVADAGAFVLADAQDRLKPVKRAGMAPGKITKGDAYAAYTASDQQLDVSFHSAPYHHNAIEPGAAIAKWDGDGGLTVHAAVQWHHIDTMALGQAFGLGMADRLPGFLARKVLGRTFEGKVRLHNHLAGGAFGRNLAMTHMFIAAMAAKLVQEPVKIALSRAQTYTLLSYRG